MESLTAISIHSRNAEEFLRRSELSEKQRDGEITGLINVIINSSRARRPEEICEEFRKAFPSYTSTDLAKLCHALSESQRYGASVWARSFFGSEDIPAGSHGKVALVRNKYNEEAFELFSKVITNPKPIYSPSFSDACEDVFDGRCEFCVLPVENSQSGRLFGFYSMFDRYELRICAVCELDAAGTSESTRYALVGKLVPDRIPKSLRWRFECSVISETGAVLGEISRVCHVFGAELSKVDSLPVEYDEKLKKYFFTFEIPENTISGFDLYLSEKYARYSPIGLYPLIV